MKDYERLEEVRERLSKLLTAIGNESHRLIHLGDISEASGNTNLAAIQMILACSLQNILVEAMGQMNDDQIFNDMKKVQADIEVDIHKLRNLAAKKLKENME